MRLELSSPRLRAELRASPLAFARPAEGTTRNTRRDRPFIFGPLALLLLTLPLMVACSGQRDDSLGRRSENSEVDGGTLTPPGTTPPASTPAAGRPAQNVVVGVNGGHAQSARFRAQVLVTFPNQPTPSVSARHSATLLPRPTP